MACWLWDRRCGAGDLSVGSFAGLEGSDQRGWISIVAENVNGALKEKFLCCWRRVGDTDERKPQIAAGACVPDSVADVDHGIEGILRISCSRPGEGHPHNTLTRLGVV